MNTIVIGAMAVVATLLIGLRRVLRGAAFWGVAAILVTWFLAALLSVWLGFYQGWSTRIPTIQYGLLIPIAAGDVLFWRWPLLQRIIESAPQEWIVSVQVYRALGLIFLVLYAEGLLPGAFALPAGCGDVLVGLLAPIVGIAVARQWRGSTSLLRAWNLLGIADLVVAVSTGFLSSPSRFQMLAFDRPNELIGAFPLAMIPVFLVPLSILLHLASLHKLRRTETSPRFAFTPSAGPSAGLREWPVAPVPSTRRMPPSP
jgi:hypothetical protein